MRFFCWNEIADSTLRNAPRTVSRATTSFRDDCWGGLSVFCCPLLFIVVPVVVFFFLRQHITTRNNIVRAVRCEQKIQPRIARICTNGDVMQKFFGLPKKIFVSICVIGYAELKVRGKKNIVPSLARNPLSYRVAVFLPISSFFSICGLCSYNFCRVYSSI